MFTSSRCSSAARRPRLRAEAIGRHRDHGVEVVTGEAAVGRGGAHQIVERGFVVVAARAFRHDLLGQDVERRVVVDDGVELAAVDGAEQGGAFDEVVARHRKEPAFGRARDRMAGSADALEQRRDAMRRSDLADEIDVADVDAELERRGRDQRLQLPGFQPRLGVDRLSLERLP